MLFVRAAKSVLGDHSPSVVQKFHLIEILLNGADISKMPIGFAAAEDLEFAVNEENCAAIGLEVPADLMG